MKKSLFNWLLEIYLLPSSFLTSINFEFPKFLNSKWKNRLLEIYLPPPFSNQSISNFQNSWESKFEVKKSRFDRSFEIYPPPLFWHQFWISKILERINSKWKNYAKIFTICSKSIPFFFTWINFKFPKLLRQWIRSERFSRFARNLPLFFYINQLRNEFEVKKSCQDFRNSLEIYLSPPFFHVNKFRISKILDEKMNSK